MGNFRFPDFWLIPYKKIVVTPEPVMIFDMKLRLVSKRGKTKQRPKN